MLWGLTALAIPVIIHLFHFRRVQKVLFTNVAFLKSATQQERSVRNLREWLVLAARLLLVAFVVLAFARPYKPITDSATSAGATCVSVFIDNSFSMMAEGQAGNHLDAALRNARLLTQNYGPETRYRLFTCDFEGRHQRFYNPLEFSALLDEVEPSALSRSLDEIIARHREAVSQTDLDKKNHKLFIFSDFQYNLAPASALLDSLPEVFIIKVAGQPFENISIDSISVSSPYVKAGEIIEFTLKITNHSPRRLDGLPLRIMQGNSQKAIATVPLEAGESKSVSLAFVPGDTGWQAFHAEIDDPAMPFDNKLFFSIRPEVQAAVMNISDGRPERHIMAAFRVDSFFDAVAVIPGSIVYSEFPRQKLITVETGFSPATGLISELKQAAENGASVLLYPAEDPSQATYFSEWVSALGAGVAGALLQNISETINLPGADNPHFGNVFQSLKSQTQKPLLNRIFALTPNPGQLSLLTTDNGKSVFTRQALGQGRLYLLTASPDANWGTLGDHFLFFPLMANTVFSGLSASELYFNLSDANVPVRGSTGNTQTTLVLRGNNMEWVPAISRRGGKLILDLSNGSNGAGNFSLLEGERLVQFVSLNYKRAESVPKFSQDEEIQSWMPNTPIRFIKADENTEFARQMAEAGNIEFWRYFIWAAIAMLAVEIYLLRTLIRHAPSPAKPDPVRP